MLPNQALSWDGQNVAGESVADEIYFYTLKLNGQAVDTTRTPQRQYFFGQFQGIFRSDDSGENWRQLAVDLSHLNYSDITVSSADADLIYLGGDCDDDVFLQLAVSPTQPEQLTAYRYRDDPKNIKSQDAGESWDTVSAIPYDLSSIVGSYIIPDPADANTIYSVMQGVEITKTTDGGRTWVDLNEGVLQEILIEQVAISAVAPKTVYILALSP